MAQVYVPAQMRACTNQQAVVEAHGHNVRELIADLDRQFPGLGERLRGADALRPGLAVVINGDYGSRGLLQPVPEDAEVHFLPAIAGG
jgi:molybdopterin synthase sulfur carrier subunit